MRGEKIASRLDQSDQSVPREAPEALLQDKGELRRFRINRMSIAVGLLVLELGMHMGHNEGQREERAKYCPSPTSSIILMPGQELPFGLNDEKARGELIFRNQDGTLKITKSQRSPITKEYYIEEVKSFRSGQAYFLDYWAFIEGITDEPTMQFGERINLDLSDPRLPKRVAVDYHPRNIIGIGLALAQSCPPHQSSSVGEAYEQG